MIKTTVIKIDTPNFTLINSEIVKGLGTASQRVMLRKSAVALKPRYTPLVKLARTAYSSGFGKRSGTLARAFGLKTWSAKRGSPRAALIFGVNDKKGRSRFQSWQQKARNRFIEVMGGDYPLPRRLSDPNFHKPSKILHLVDNSVKSHTIRPKYKKVLAAPEQGEGALWPVSRNSGGWTGRGVLPRIRKKGEDIARRRQPAAFNKAFEQEVGKKLKSAYRSAARTTAS